MSSSEPQIVIDDCSKNQRTILAFGLDPALLLLHKTFLPLVGPNPNYFKISFRHIGYSSTDPVTKYGYKIGPSCKFQGCRKATWRSGHSALHKHCSASWVAQGWGSRPTNHYNFSPHGYTQPGRILPAIAIVSRFCRIRIHSWRCVVTANMHAADAPEIYPRDISHDLKLLLQKCKQQKLAPEELFSYTVRLKLSCDGVVIQLPSVSTNNSQGPHILTWSKEINSFVRRLTEYIKSRLSSALRPSFDLTSSQSHKRQGQGLLPRT